MPYSLPVIGASRRLPRVTYAFGDGHLGLTVCVGGLSRFAAWAGQCPIIDLTPLRPGRF
ncbi:hypothetical protein [Rhizobium bangladeshense]|nr:hypothetical protein [Rhizobium bangladeshense]